jgi:hypothetical protein
MTTAGCGIIHKDKKQTDNKNKIKTTQREINEISDKYFFKIMYR